MNLNYDRRIMHDINDDARIGLAGHVAPYYYMTERASSNMILAHNIMLNHIAQSLMPDNNNHTGDSGTYH